MLLATADLHLNNLPRDQYRHDFQKQLRELVKKHHVGTVIINGDLTDDKDFHPATLVNKVVDHIHALAQLCDVIINTGNHDYTALASTPFFRFLSRVDGVYWVGEPTRGESISSKHTTKDLSRVLFLPHSPNPARDWKNVNFGGIDLVFAHQTFDGALSEHGQRMEGVDCALIPMDIKVLSGDVHTPQRVGLQVTYIGAPYTVDFGDSYDPRIMLLDNGKLTSIPVDGPQKRLIEVTAGELPKLKAKQTLEQLSEGDILKVRVELDHSQYAKWAEFKDEVYAWGAKHGFVINMVQPVHKKAAVAKKAVKRIDHQSDKEIVSAFVKRHKIDEHTAKIGDKFVETT